MIKNFKKKPQAKRCMKKYHKTQVSLPGMKNRPEWKAFKKALDDHNKAEPENKYTQADFLCKVWNFYEDNGPE